MTGQTISHYRILEKLGEGGMGVVYKAEDTKLRRTVALKFLPPHALENRERFLREAQAAAALNHPNICTVYEIDEEHGFLAMELIDGVSVKDKIAVRPLPLEEALDIATQACNGLQAAHEKGIVHRDIKSANLMLTAQGQVKIMDFGLAQVGDRTRITKTGSSLGTPAYMSPEQAKGDAVDRRTDIWSLGVVLYEMLAGRLPFRGDTEPAVTYAIVHTEPEPVTALRTGLPKELDRILAKAFRKNPAERYSHVEDLLVDLRAAGKPVPSAHVRRRIPVLALLTFAVAVAGWLGWTRLRPSPPPAVRSLAVLPFRLLSAAAADDYLGLGMADSVIAKVSQIPGLTVRPTSAVRKYAAADTEALTAARALGVDAVLDGNLQRSNDRLRVSVNLIDVASGASLWADTFNVASGDLFAVQDEVALRVVSQLRYRLNSTERARLVRRHTSNPLAYEYYQKAMRIFERRTATMPTSDYESAIALFRKAIESDPNYALARAQLAHAYVWMGLFREPDNSEWIRRARDELSQAERLDRDLAEVHFVRAEILYSIHGNFQLVESIRERQLGRRLDPSAASPELGSWYCHVGLDEHSLREARRALQIDPLSQGTQARLVEALTCLARHSEAVAEHQRLFNRSGPTESLIALGRLDEAQPLVEAEIAANPRSPYPLGNWVLLQAMRGRFSQVESKIPIIQSARRDRSFHHATYAVARVYALQGKGREAVEWLRTTVDTGMPNYPVFARDPLLSRIRQTPEYVAFMADLKPRWEKLVREIEEQ